ncbi:hypothetical protein ABZX12_04430 [Kribbella sp. NPDC003505]|uniref:hypothetical protein n=1 Tax=Kribbella sp. NPDC003505 TaxID=3154448 RepID=UPI0033A7F45F
MRGYRGRGVRASGDALRCNDYGGGRGGRQAEAAPGVGAAAAASNMRINWPEGYEPVDPSKTNSVVGTPRRDISFTEEMTEFYKYDNHTPAMLEIREYDASGKLVKSSKLKTRSKWLMALRIFGRVFG